MTYSRYTGPKENGALALPHLGGNSKPSFQYQDLVLALGGGGFKKGLNRVGKVLTSFFRIPLTAFGVLVGSSDRSLESLTAILGRIWRQYCVIQGLKTKGKA